MSPWLWVVALLAGGVWFTLNREKKLAKKTVIRWLNFVLFSLFVVALLYAPWGSWHYPAYWFAYLVDGLFGWLGLQLGGVPASGLAFALVVILTIAGVIDLFGRKKDSIARVAVISIPILAIVAGGWLGTAIQNGVNGVGDGSAHVVREMSS